MWWLGRRISTYWRPFELDNRTRIVDFLAPGEGVGVWIRASGCSITDAKCDYAQANRREYQQCYEDFFHIFIGQHVFCRNTIYLVTERIHLIAAELANGVSMAMAVT